MQEFLEHADLIVEAFSFLTAALIAGGSFYSYSKTHKPRHAAFGFAFFLVAVGMFLSMIFNWFVELELVTIPLRGYLSIGYTLTAVLMLSMLAVLMGFLTLILVNEQITNPKIIVLTYLLAPLSVWVAHEFYTGYHLILLLVIALVFAHYATNHSREPGKHSLPIAAAFGILLVSQIIFALSVLSPYFYVVGHLLRFVSFGVLFVTLISIYRTAKITVRKKA